MLNHMKRKLNKILCVACIVRVERSGLLGQHGKWRFTALAEDKSVSGISGIKHYFLLAGAMVCLSACNSMQELAQVFVDENRAGGTFGFGKEEPAHQTIDMSGYMSNENVEVYSMEDKPSAYEGKRKTLPSMEPVYRDRIGGNKYPPPPRENVSYGYPVDGTGAAVDRFKPQSAEERGLPSTDSSVTLYPLEDVPPGYPVSRPLYPEQRQQYQGRAPSPYGGPQGYAPYGQAPAMPQTDAYVPGGAHAMQPQYQQRAMPVQSLPARIYFDHGKTTLDVAAREVLSSVAEDIRRNHNVRVRVDGYASSRASGESKARRAANMKTSIARAQNVADELIRQGVPESAIEVAGYGDTKAGTEQAGVSSEAASRRVEIHQIR